MAGYSSRWWIAGGWAIEAFSGVSRRHGDLDLSVPRQDLAMLRQHLAGRLDLWAADQQTLTVLLPDDVATTSIADSCENVWARASGDEPWQYDIVLMHGDARRWVFKRNHRINLPWDQITWTRDEIPYLRPEIQLLHKARGLRPKDQVDFDNTAPRLDEPARTWLRDKLALAHPDHPWLTRLAA